jgi:hypothetical protein
MLSWFTGGVEQGSRREVIARLGGTSAAARITGMSARQMRRWASGETRNPGKDALSRLNRADAVERMRQAGTRLDDQGRPTDKAFLRASGHVRANGETDTPTYAYDRELGSQGTHAGDPGLLLDDETVGYVVDALAAGDDAGQVQWAVESDLSRNVMGVNYDPDARGGDGIGMFLDRIDVFEIRQQPDPYWPT